MKAIEFAKAFRTAASQLNTYALAGDWMRLAQRFEADGVELTAAQAAAWASQGFYPGEAESMIRDGVTPEMHREMEAHAEEQAGGPDNLAAMRIAELLGSGAFLGPDDVISVLDPTNPTVEIIVPREDIDEA